MIRKPNIKIIALPSPRSSSAGPEHLALAARATNDAIRDWNVKAGALSWPQGLDTLLGFEPERRLRKKSVSGKSRSIPTIALGRVASIRDALADGEHWSGEYRFRHADGRYLHLLERAVIVRDEEGKALRFVGSLMDITARKQLQDQLVRSQKMEGVRPARRRRRARLQ
ncbi:MAG: PAS domain-containing protein [Geodermatophilaceae bacterium]